MIAFSCSRCGMKLKVMEQFAGRSSKCPTCKQPLIVPPAGRTIAEVGAGDIDGTDSSLAKVGHDGGVTLEPPAAARAGQRSVQELLARRTKKEGRYLVEREIARGGMGAVLRAVDCDIRREVAVKYLLDQTDPGKKARFIEEAQITGQLEHPNIVPIHELGVDAHKRIFFSMKMVKGRSLADALDELRQDPKVAAKQYSLGKLLNVLVNVCNALAYAHSCGVVHRDLKPANIMLGDFGEVYVMDWGLAKVLKDGRRNQTPATLAAAITNVSGIVPLKIETSRGADADLTQEGAVLGTPVYMSPEQATGKLEAIDQRSDVYALGAILYEMLTLQPPVEKEGGYLAILMRVTQGEIVPPEQRAGKRSVPKELAAVAMKALATNPQERYPTVEALRKDIERFQEGRSVSAKEDKLREVIWKWVKRNRGASLTAAVAFVAMIGVLSFSFRAVYGAYSELKQEQTAKRLQGKKSAPLFFQDAKASAMRRNIEYALAQVSVALEYDPDIAEARLLKGQLLIVTRDFAAARRELEQYSRSRPDDRDTAALLELCRKAHPEDAISLAAFGDILERQKAYGLADLLMQDRDKLVRLYAKRIDAVWPSFGRRLAIDKDGKCSLDLTEVAPKVTDLAPLEGIPLTRLVLNNCNQVRDLTPLRGMPLTSLDLSRCNQVRDLSPLSGMKLTSLTLINTPVTDLTPLRGMPLASLILHGCRQTDLSPLPSLPLTYLDLGFCTQLRDLNLLKGMRLTGLSLFGCEVRDLTPLRDMPLVSLNLQSCNRIQDLTPLRGLPLTTLNIFACAQVRDLTPLQGANLKEITFGARMITRGIDALRGMPSLQLIRVSTLRGDELKPAEFWKRYDAGDFKP